MNDTFDAAVVGGGIAGLSAALLLAERMEVALYVKRDLMDSATRYAQGGIAAVQGDDDTFGMHADDTRKAGAGLCRADVVQHVVALGPQVMADLRGWGVRFDEADDCPALGQEGGHSRRRVARVKDQTGLAIQESLVERALEHPRVHVFEQHMAVDVLTRSRVDRGQAADSQPRFDSALGLYVLDLEHDVVKVVGSRAVVLATGGAGKVYRYTSNPDIASGDGVAMAYRAGARIANMEFFQFHPTCLYHPQAKSFLISEAVRGEGGVLKARRGGDTVPFMGDYHPMESLAPRDIVARAIDAEIKRSGHPCVYLDIRQRSERFLQRRFANILAKCRELGVNMASDLIPVVPAAHYCCGGVRTDTNGTSTVKNLYALGEVGCTGLHGANRLASNSLLEALAVAHNAVQHSLTLQKDTGRIRSAAVPDWSSGDAIDSDEQIVIAHNWDEIRRFMWDYVGIVRTDKRLERAKNRIRLIRNEIEKYYWDFFLTPDLVELRNLASVAEMIVDSAMARKESRGLHFNTDHPETNGGLNKDTILRRPTKAEIWYE